MTESDALTILHQQKHGDPPERWSQKPSHGSALVLAFGLTDSDGITLPGLHVTLEWQPPKRLRRSTLLLGLQLRQNGITDRVYQLEICPHDHPSHLDHGIMRFGAHEHIGATTIMPPSFSGISFEPALGFFVQRTNIALANPIQGPDAFELT